MNKEKVKTTKKVQTSVNKSAFAPLLLCAVCILLELAATVIDNFIFSFGNEILSPILRQIIILLIPAYLYLLLRSPQKSLVENISWLGIKRLRAEYIFFLFYASFFAISASLMLNVIFGGVYDAANGFSLLGLVAGKNEFSISSWYLIFSYAIIPAFIEEIFFRGLLYRELESNGKKLAVIFSALIFAFFSFSPRQIPSVLVCGLIYSLARAVTDSLQASMIIHFVFNLYGLFFQTNISLYYISSRNNSLLIIIIIFCFLLSGSLFFAELARIYRSSAADGSRKVKEDKLTLKDAKNKVAAVFSHRPTIVAAIICLVLYIASVIICQSTFTL